jgi:quercetin dioxygenase-like cupin family protein
MGARVEHERTAPPAAADGVSAHALAPSEGGSELALEGLRLENDASLALARDEHDTLIHVFGGSGTLTLDDVSHPLADGTAALVLAGEHALIRAGGEGLALVRITVGAAVDLHAPMGPRDVIQHLDAVEPGQATGSRSFQVLFDARNGSTRATLFVGHVPPGRAPWHYHLYDEICWIVSGEGRLHIGETVEPLEPGSTFRLHAREVHIVENTQADRELSILGVFTPAGSPSAAYLQPGVFAAYVMSARDR